MFENSPILFVAIFLLVSVIGYGISLLFAKGELTRRLLISPIVGYSIITIINSTLGYLGFSIEQVYLPVLLCLLVLSVALILLIKNQRAKNTPLKFFLPILFFGLANAGIVLAPTILNQTPLLFNDHTLYISMSEYVREYSYTDLSNANIEQWQLYTMVNQRDHFRMGAKFFVAFITATFDVPHTLFIYPAILGFIGLFNTIAVSFLYLCLRSSKHIKIQELILVLFFRP